MRLEEEKKNTKKIGLFLLLKQKVFFPGNDDEDYVPFLATLAGLLAIRSVMMDASMYVIHPRCRSLAVGIQLLITKIGGEAWSAYLIGFVS